MTARRSATAVGAFVVCALVLGVAAVVILGSGKFFHKTYAFVVYFRGSVDGLGPGRTVKTAGIDVGSVRDVYLNLSEERRQVDPKNLRIPVIIELDPAKLTKRGVPAQLDDPRTIEQLIKLGLRARLTNQSLLTGDRGITLDFVPDSPIDLVADPSVPFQEIPTVVGEFDSAQKQVIGLVNQVASLPIEHLVVTADHAVASIDRLVSSPDLPEIVAAAKQAIVNLRDATANLNAAALEVRKLGGQLGPDATAITSNLITTTAALAHASDHATALIDDVNKLLPAGSSVLSASRSTLSDLSNTLRSIRLLVEHLERDPGAILRGGNP